MLRCSIEDSVGQRKTTIYSTVAPNSLGKANKEVSEVNFIDFFFSGAAAKRGLSVEDKIEFLEHVSFNVDTLTS